MKNTGLRKACLYALPPYRLGLCGPIKKSKTDLISGFLDGNEKNAEKVKNVFIKTFPMIKYLKMIAEKHNLDIFDKQVVEAYWIGNHLLDDFFKQGELIPFHLFVLLIESDYTSKVKSCQISWKKINNNWASVHWGETIEVLSGKEIKQLKKYTKLTLNLYK